MRKISLLLITIVTTFFYSCDAHKIDAEQIGVQPKQVLCTDGKTYSLADCKALEKTPFAVVFFIDNEDLTDGIGYAVYLWDTESESFADSTGVKQNTSSSLETYDGMENTFKLLSTKAVSSPMAESVYALLPHGQQAFIPSVAEMRLLYDMKDVINPIIKECGGDVIPTEPENCWYWTSTEVKGHETVSAWLYSLSSGLYLPTLKTQFHKVRPILQLRY